MNNAWSVEFTRILLIVITAILFGLVSGYWTIAILLSCGIYIGWTLIQIRTFERWIRLGGKTSMAPDSNGIWQLIVQHIYRTQKKNQDHKTRLTELVKRFEATIAALPDATIVLNSHFEIEWANKITLDLLGVDNQKDIGQRFDNLIRNPQLQSLLIGGDQNQQLEMESPVDHLKTLILTCVDFGNQQKLITARDISQRLAVQKLRKAFIANASHELRTPLTVIAGYLEMLDSDGDLPEMTQKLIGNANQQALRMQKILDDLLILSKLEEKGFSKESGESIDMPALLHTLVSDFKKTKAKDTSTNETLNIEVDIDQNLLIRATEGELYSLSQNLLSNAIKYSPEGANIKVSWLRHKDGKACLTVTDNGEGIAPEHLSRLTERFYRVNVQRSRQVGGTGLGLSIVKHIIENYGGYLGIESKLGKGSSFSAYFPAYRVVNSSLASQ